MVLGRGLGQAACLSFPGHVFVHNYITYLYTYTHMLVYVHLCISVYTYIYLYAHTPFCEEWVTAGRPS